MAWLGFRRNNPNRSLYGRTVTLSGEMSPQERSGDFSELCSFIEMNAPIVNFTLKNSFEELYGISYQSIKDQVIICKGGILPSNTYYDCGSFVVNRKAVIGKEKKSLVTAENSVQNGAVAYNRKLKPALWTI